MGVCLGQDQNTRRHGCAFVTMGDHVWYGLSFIFSVAFASISVANLGLFDMLRVQPSRCSSWLSELKKTFRMCKKGASLLTKHKISFLYSALSHDLYEVADIVNL